MKTPVLESSVNRVAGLESQAWNLTKKETRTQVFSQEF